MCLIITDVSFVKRSKQMEPLTNETVKKLIEESGEMWEAMRDRISSPVLIQVDEQPSAFAYELSLPAGEHHPFWRVLERELTPEEDASRMRFLESGAYRFGDLMSRDVKGSYFRVRAYVFNGRREAEWDISVDRVEVEIVRSSSVNSRTPRETPILNNQTPAIEKALIRWQMRAIEYLSLGENESDPIGKKFYESYALGVGNCIAEVTDILVGREPGAV
jgi:hypothetical protein